MNMAATAPRARLMIETAVLVAAPVAVAEAETAPVVEDPELEPEPEDEISAAPVGANT
jgi:hypothetical protein